MKFLSRQTRNFLSTERMLLTAPSSYKLTSSGRNLAANKQQKSCYFVGFATVLTLLYFTYTLYNVYAVGESDRRNKEYVIIDCYWNRNLSEKYRLSDVLLDGKVPMPGKSYFFLETSCSSDGNIKLNAR